ncbi:MAG: portal protein [Desulfuromonadales bacterium]|nr:portal protein [Desulfuromonadales bacterium]
MGMKSENQQIIEKMQARKAALNTERSSFVPHWQEIAEFISTRTSRFLRNDRNRGDKVNQKIINETATLALRTLESGLMAGMSSPARPWFVLGPPDPEMREFGPVKDWLDTVTRLMREVFSRSNLYSALPKQYSSLGAYATGAFGLLEDEKEVVRCYPFPIGSYMIDCNERMNVDTLYREFSMTVRQLVAKFGEKNVSPTVKAMWDRGNYGEWVPVIHAIEPNFSNLPGKLDARDKPYLSVYYEEGQKQALRISGFDEFPAIVSRWHVNGEDAYGTRCPGMDALGSVKALQLEERRKYQAMDKIVNGPVNADATLRNTGVDLLPGGVNWIPNLSQSAGAAIRPVYDIDARIIDVLRQDIAEVNHRIRRTFFEDLMLMLSQGDNPEMTAREIEERHQEKVLVLGPMMEQQNDDLFDPLIDRTFNIMLRRGMFPEPPEELQGMPLRVEYTSVMAQAQKLIGIGGIERFVGFVGNLSQMRPDAMDKADIDQVIDEYGDMLGIPSKIIVPDEKVRAIREQRAQQQQMQQAAEMAPALSQGAQAAKTLSETNVQDVSALTRLIGGA